MTPTKNVFELGEPHGKAQLKAIKDSVEFLYELMDDCAKNIDYLVAKLADNSMIVPERVILLKFLLNRRLMQEALVDGAKQSLKVYRRMLKRNELLKRSEEE